MKTATRRRYAIAALLALAVLLPVACISLQDPPTVAQVAGKPRDVKPVTNLGLWKTLHLYWEFAFDKPADTAPAGPLPVVALSRQQLLDAPDGSLFRLGHSTILLKLRSGFWLTDPVFSERASPVQWVGPARFHAPPIAIADLPPLRGVMLSHDHYDHLDKASVRALAAKTEMFFAPLGVGNLLLDWGIAAAKIRQFDWWQEAEAYGVRVIATPAQHFSGRGLFDGNETLWTSWVVIEGGLRIYFSGDTGYFAGFKAIGEKYGPFDLALLEVGAYDKRWPYIHMQPEEALRAHRDLGARWLLPIHNGTFDLGLHPWYEPFERIAALGAGKGIAVTTPRMGERLDLRRPHAGDPWWREVPGVRLSR